MAGAGRAGVAGPAGDILSAESDRERFAELLGIKEQANGKFKEGDYFSAKCLYSGALEMLERCCAHMDKADDTWQGLKNNMALCDLRRKEWSRVIETTTEILARNPKNAKALYRRGVARMGHGKLADAQRDFRAVVEMEPGNADARQRLAEAVQQMKEMQASEREQADKIRGFLKGERLDDTVAITQDGSARKVHSNENAPLLPSWMKREWMSTAAEKAAVVTCHVVVKTQSGKELWTSRKPPGALSTQPAGPHMATQAKPAERPVEPVRFVLDDAQGGVFLAWNAAAKTLQLGELGRYEVAPRALGPSVDPAVQQCIATWLPDTPKRRELFKDVPEDIREGARRRQALQILGLPEELCLDGPASVGGDDSALRMEVELLDVSEYSDVSGDGRTLLRVLREGRGPPAASELSKVVAHFRIAKLLPNVALVDTRMGLAKTSDGLVMRVDKSLDPMEFVVGEEAAAEQGEFVPPCIGRCLAIPKGGVTAGMQFELVLRDGVPISDMEQPIYTAYAKGALDREAVPDTAGPVAIRIEVEQVEPAVSGPSDASWLGAATLRRERERAELLQALDDGIHWKQSLKRWRRIVDWLVQLIEPEKVVGGSMYDLEWDDDEGGEAAAVEVEASAPAAAAAEAPGPCEGRAATPEETRIVRALQMEADALAALGPEELVEWVTAHTAIARLLSADGTGPADGAAVVVAAAGGSRVAADRDLVERHARCAVKASAVGDVPAPLQIAARVLLAEQLLASCSADGCRTEAVGEALEILRPAQALDPTDQAIRNLVAKANQRDSDRKAVGVREALKTMKHDLIAAVEADDAPALRTLLATLDTLPLTWEAASEFAIGKEVGKCARHADESVATVAKGIIGKLHRLAKQDRPLWVR